MAEILRVGDPPINVLLRRNPRARRMILRIGASHVAPVLTLPPAASLTAARGFLVDHVGWMRARLAAAPRGVVIGDGTALPFGDGLLTIRAASGRRLRQEGDTLHVPGRPEDMPPRVAAFLREAARAACAEACDRYAAALGRPVGRLTLRDPRGRWGSCTASGDLMFSWRLVLAPRSVLDYVAAHEVAHLAEMNHSPRFWAVVARLRPDYAAPREWLRRHGASLHGYDFARRDAA